MKHYRLPDGSLRGIDKGQEELVKADWSELTAEEFDALRNPPMTEEGYKNLGQDLAAKHIQDVIEAYNQAHGLSFKDAHSCANYMGVDGYTHQQFCIDIWAFNVQVWEEVRNVILPGIDFTNPPTEAEFIAMLPAYHGEV
ncbi:MAG: hypothetical protein ABXS91_10570 [Sulfurimonas sp.]